MAAFGILIALAVLGGFGLGIAGFFLGLSASRRSDQNAARIGDLEFRTRSLMREIDMLASGQAKRINADAPVAAGSVTPSKTSQPDAAIAESEKVMATAPAKTTEASPPSKVSADILPPVEAAKPALVATPSPGFEERLGTRWAVWVGGVALGLGALLLVRYSIEQGIFGPGVRILMGAAFSALLIAAGEWLRRGEVNLGIAAVPSAHIPGVLTAAGTVGLFGTIYAAHALYGFIGAGLAFTLLGLVGIATMMAASLHGPALAGLGLVGALAVPLLVSSDTPNPWPVVVYLAVVAAAAYGLAKTRQWTWLAATAAAGTILWGAIMALEAVDLQSWIAPAMLNALIQLGVAAYAFSAISGMAPVKDRAAPYLPGTLVLGGFALLFLLVLVANAGVSPASMTFTALGAAVLTATGWRTGSLTWASAIAGLLVLGALLVWPSLIGSRILPDLDLEPAVLFFTPPDYPGSFLALGTLGALAIAIVSGLRLYGSKALMPWSASVHAATAALLPLAALVLCYARISNFNTSIVFALAAAVLAGLFAVAAGSFQLKEKGSGNASLALGTGALAAASVAAAALALIFYLDRGYLTVALAIAAMGAAVMADLKGIPALRYAVAALGLLVLARIVWDPRIMGEDVGTTPILNWLLFGYGIPAAAFYASARVLERGDTDIAQRISDALAIVFAGLLAFFQIRHLLNNGDVFAPTTDHVEQGLMTLTALGFSFALLRAGVGRGNPVYRVASLAFAALSVLSAVLGLGLHENPLFAADPVRSAGPLDSLWLGYLLPSLGAAYLARAASDAWPDVAVRIAGALAVALLFGFVTLEVRHIFQGPMLGIERTTSDGEFWSYSAAWLALGAVLLAYGLWRGMVEARLASAALVVLTVLKVFLWDMAGLEGALRAFSFIGLGLVLLGIGLVYQKFVFGPGGTKRAS